MKRKGLVRSMIVLYMCLLVVHLHAQEAIQVIGLFSDGINLGCGSEQGVKEGATGRIYLREMVEGKMLQIFIAEFRIISVDTNECQAKILTKIREVGIGHFVEFDHPLKPLMISQKPLTEAKSKLAKYPVRIVVEPADAEITINGTAMGFSPLQVELDTPRCEVHLIRSGFESFTDAFDLSEGGLIKNYKMNPLVSGGLSRDQRKQTSAMPLSLSAKELERKIAGARSIRTWGWILFVPSFLWTGFMVVGSIVSAALSEEEAGNGVIAGIPSTILQIIGLSMIISGNRKVKRYRQMKADLVLGLDIRPYMKRYGISLAFLF